MSSTVFSSTSTECEGRPAVRMGRPGRPIITNLGRFASSVEASAMHGLSPSHCHARAKRQIEGWHFEDEPLRFRRKWAIPVMTPEGAFSTVSAAAKRHGICCATVEARIRRGEPGWHYAARDTGGRAAEVDAGTGRLPSYSGVHLSHRGSAAQ